MSTFFYFDPLRNLASISVFFQIHPIVAPSNWLELKYALQSANMQIIVQHSMLWERIKWEFLHSSTSFWNWNWEFFIWQIGYVCVCKIAVEQQLTMVMRGYNRNAYEVWRVVECHVECLFMISVYAYYFELFLIIERKRLSSSYVNKISCRKRKKNCIRTPN